jgi:hypothetical protein
MSCLTAAVSLAFTGEPTLRRIVAGVAGCDDFLVGASFCVFGDGFWTTEAAFFGAAVGP